MHRTLLPLIIVVFMATGLSACDGDGSSVTDVKCQCYCPRGKCPDVTCSTPDLLTPDVVEEPDEDVPVVIPELKIALSVEQEVLSGIAQIEATVTGGQAIMGVEFYVDAIRIETDQIPPYNVTVNTTDFPDGSHYVSAFTADTAGNTATDAETFTFDNTPPAITGTTPVEGDVVFMEDGPLNVSMDVDDPAAIKSALIRANGLLVGEFLAPPFTASINWANLFIDINSLPKNVYLQYEAVDYLGQKGEATLNVAVHRRLAWSYETVGEIWGTARALNNGNVVFGNSNHKVYCLNPQGSLVWSFTADQQIIEAPAVDPSTNQVYVGTVGGTVYGLTANGSEYWSKSIGTPVGGDLVFSNGLVYVAGFNGSVIAMQPSNGNSQWEASLTTQVMGAPAVASDGTVYVGGQDKIMYAVQNGSVKWSIPTGGEIWSTPAVGADYTVYFGSNDGWVYALKPDGSTKWVMDVGGQIWGQPLIATDGHIIVASTSKYVTKLEPNFGVQIWTTKTEGITNSSPVQAADGTLMVGTTGGKIFAIEPEAGVVQWTYQVGNTIHATPLLLDNRAYFGSTDRNFYSLQLTPEGEGQ